MRAIHAAQDLKALTIAPVVTKVLDVLCSIDMLFLLRNDDTPFRECNMPDVRCHDFQSSTICSFD